jgi:hypothetical protein
MLRIVFSALVALAPVLYGVFRTPVQVSNKGMPQIQYQGFVGISMLSAGLTLRAALGQIATTFYVIRDLGMASVFAPNVQMIFCSSHVVRPIFWVACLEGIRRIA